VDIIFVSSLLKHASMWCDSLAKVCGVIHWLNELYYFQPPLTGAVRPAQTDIPTYSGDVLLKWNEFWDMFKASVHKDKRYADIDNLKSKLSGDALEAIAGYQLSNDNYKIVLDVLKKRFGNKQVVINS